MKILVLGRGVIASVYGWALAEAGHEVEFLVREGRTAEYGPAIDLDLLDLRRRPWGTTVRRRWDVTYRERLDPSDGFDLVVVSVGHHRLVPAVEQLAPRIGAATVLILGNVWDERSAVLDALPQDRVVWGFPGAGGGFQPDGRLRAGLMPSIRLGTPDGPGVGERHTAVRSAFRDAGVRIRDEDDMPGWLAVHFVTDAGILAQGLRLGTLSRLPGRTGDLRAALLTGRELLPLLEARGVDLARHRGATALLRHPRLTAPALSWATAHLAPARISMEAHTDPHAEEPRAVCRDALASARRHGIDAPLLAATEPLFAT